MASTFKKYYKQSVGTGNTVVYNPTTANIQSTIIGMSIANKQSNAISVSVMVSSGANAASAGANSVYIIKDATVPPGTSLIPIGGDQKLVLVSDDYLECFTNAASSADVLLSVLEIT